MPIDLVWNAPNECLRQTEVASDVAHLTGQTETLSRLRAVAVVTKTSTGHWAVRIETASAEGTARRTIEGESCSAVADATALYLAVALAPEAATAFASEPPSVRTEQMIRDAAPPNVAAPNREALAPAQSGKARVSIGASSRVDTATLPRPAVGGELSASWRRRPLRVELTATYWLPEDAGIADTPRIGGRFSMTSAALRACYEHEFGALTLAPCASFAIDHVAGEGYGELHATRASTTWIGASFGGLGAWSFTRALALRFAIDAEVPLARPRFYVEGSEISRRVAAVSARAGIGVELTIP